MKNVIFIVCDGLTYDILENRTVHPSPMPFLYSLYDKSTWCTKVYSHGPYTEAGIMGLCYGRNPLDEGTYFAGNLKWKNSIFEAFKKNGYDIFTSYFGSFTPPELLMEGSYVYPINYTSPMFSRDLRSKLDYFRPFYEKHENNDKDDRFIIDLLDSFFKAMLWFRDGKSLENNKIGNFCPYVISEDYLEKYTKWYDQLTAEHNSFIADSKKYLYNVFNNYETHFLTNGCNLCGSSFKKEVIEQRKYVTDKYSPLFKKVIRKNKIFFKKNRQFPTRQIIRMFKDVRSLADIKKAVEYVYRAKQAYSDFNTSKMCDLSLGQVVPSARAYIRSLIKWTKESNCSNPFFSYLHLDEFHRPISIYSHDIVDKDLIDREMAMASNYVANISEKYKGNISFDLSAQYLDDCIKELYLYLEESHLIDNTILVITADHGSSNVGGFVRKNTTNNFYKEQYHIPCVILGLEKRTIDTYIDIKDIPYTVLQSCCIPIPNTFNGESIFFSKKDHSFVEYLGSGVADLQRRPVLFSHIDDNVLYVISYSFDGSHDVVEYYDLKHDPYQLNNIASCLSEEKKEKLIKSYGDRSERLKNNYTKWLGGLCRK